LSKQASEALDRILYTFESASSGGETTGLVRSMSLSKEVHYFWDLGFLSAE
jgi:hypothetical protein